MASVENVFNAVSVVRTASSAGRGVVSSRQRPDHLWRRHSRRLAHWVKVGRVWRGARCPIMAVTAIRMGPVLGVPGLVRSVTVFARIGAVTFDWRSGSAGVTRMVWTGRSSLSAILLERHFGHTGQHGAVGVHVKAAGDRDQFVVTGIIRVGGAGSRGHRRVQEAFVRVQV